MSWITIVFFLFHCVACGQALSGCGVGDVTVENDSCWVDSKSCSDITNLHIKDSGHVLFLESCNISGEISVSGSASHMTFAEDVRVEAIAYIIEEATHSFGAGSSLRSHSCRVTKQSRVYVPDGAKFDCTTMVVDKTSSIDVTGLHRDGSYSASVPNTGLQLSLRADTLVLLGNVDLSHRHTRCGVIGGHCEHSMSVRMESKSLVLGPTTLFGASEAPPQLHNMNMHIVSDNKAILKWYSLFSKTAFRGLTGTFSYSTLAGFQHTLSINPVQPLRQLAVDAPTSSTGYRRLLSFSSSKDFATIVLPDASDRHVNHPKVRYYIMDDGATAPKLSVECNVDVYLLPDLDVKEILKFENVDTILHKYEAVRFAENDCASSCFEHGSHMDGETFSLDIAPPVARSVASVPECNFLGGNLHVNTNCRISTDVEVDNIVNPMGHMVTILGNVKLVARNAHTFTDIHLFLEEGATVHFKKDVLFDTNVEISMNDGSILSSAKKLELQNYVSAYGQITLKATDLVIGASATIEVRNSPNFSNSGTPPTFSGNDPSTLSGGCHTGYWLADLEGYNPKSLANQPLQGQYLYGSVIYPTSQGSNGAADSRFPTQYGRGGGAVVFEALDKLYIQGLVDVRGMHRNPVSEYGGGGAGGSILFKTNKLMAFEPNRLLASGGTNGRDAELNVSGSGGRIALHCFEDLSGANYMIEDGNTSPAKYFDVSSYRNTQGTVWVNCGRHMNTLYLPSTSTLSMDYDVAVIDASEFANVIIRKVVTTLSFFAFRLEAATKPLLVGELFGPYYVLVFLIGPGGHFVLGAKPVINNNCYSYTLTGSCNYAVKRYMRTNFVMIYDVNEISVLTLPENLEMVTSYIVNFPIANLKSLRLSLGSNLVAHVSNNLSLDHLVVEISTQLFINYIGNENNVFQMSVQDSIIDGTFLIVGKKVLFSLERGVFSPTSFTHAFYVVTQTGNASNAGSLTGKIFQTDSVPSSLSTDIEYPRTPGVAYGGVPFLTAGSAIEIDGQELYFLGTMRCIAYEVANVFFHTFNTASSSGGSILVQADTIYMSAVSVFITQPLYPIRAADPFLPNSGGRIAVHMRTSNPTPRAQLFLANYHVAGAQHQPTDCRGASGTVFLDGDGLERMLIVGSSNSKACDAATVIGLRSDLSIGSFFVHSNSPVEVHSLDNAVYTFKVAKHIDGNIAAEYPALVDLATETPFAFKNEWLINNAALATTLNGMSAPSSIDRDALELQTVQVVTETSVMQKDSDTVMSELLQCKYMLGSCSSLECDENSSDFVSTGRARIDLTVYSINRSIYNPGNIDQLSDAFRRNVADSTGVPLDSIQSSFVSQDEGVIQMRIDIALNVGLYRRSELIDIEIGLADFSPIHCTGFIST